MPDILLAQASYQRSGFPRAVLRNALTEASPTKPQKQFSIIARPGDEDFTTVGTAPIRGVFQQDGLLGDAAFIVALTGAYLVTSGGVVTALTGSIAGDALVEIAGGIDPDGNSVIRIATGDAMYIYNSSGGSVMAEDFPTAGGAGATSVAYGNGYWWATETGTGFIWNIPPASSTWGPLDFAGEDYKPDNLLGVRVVGKLAWLLGTASLVAWRATGDATSALEPVGGLEFDIGCRNISTAVNCGGELIFVDSLCGVRRTGGGAPENIADNGLTEQIANTPAADLSGGFYVLRGHPCYVLHLGTSATKVYDLSTQRWSQFNSLTYDYWRPRLFATIGDTVLASDRLSNQLVRLDPDRATDGNEVFTRSFMGFVPVTEGSVPLGSVELDCLLGDAPRSGQGSDPLIGMRMSHDGGETWDFWDYQSLGTTGNRSIPPRWNACGSAHAPHGVIFEWQVSDPVGFRVTAARYQAAA